MRPSGREALLSRGAAQGHSVATRPASSGEDPEFPMEAEARRGNLPLQQVHKDEDDRDDK